MTVQQLLFLKYFGTTLSKTSTHPNSHWKRKNFSRRKNKTMLARNQLTRKSHLLFRWAAFSRTSTSHISNSRRIPVCNPIYLNRSFASCHSRITLPSANGFKVFGRPEFGFKHSGLLSLRVSSGSGSGGKAGGGFGGSGNGSSGGGGGSIGGGAGGSNWSFLSW